MASWRAPGSILEAPGSIFEAPRIDLGGFRNDFFNIFGQNTKKAKKRLKPAKQELNHKWPDCQGWVGGGAPPRGVSMELEPSWPKKRAEIDRNSNLEARSGYNSMLEADKFEFGAQDKVFFAILGQLGSNSIETPRGGTTAAHPPLAVWQICDRCPFLAGF